MSKAEVPWLCATCAVEYPPGPQPTRCPICSDERQYVRPSGQRWTTLTELDDGERRATVRELEPGLYGIGVEPAVGIGQQALLVRTAHGNLLWDPVGYLDDALVSDVEDLGGLAVIATSHPHMFGAQVSWSRRFGEIPVLVNAYDAEWLQRDDPLIQRWDDEAEPLPGVRLRRIGGHFPGSAVAHLVGADGRGVLLSGDTVAATPDHRWVSFLRSYPNKLPLSAAVVEVLARRLAELDVDRLYDNFDGRVDADAGAWVQRSADRYVAWVSGAYDHLTGTTSPAHHP